MKKRQPKIETVDKNPTFPFNTSVSTPPIRENCAYILYTYCMSGRQIDPHPTGKKYAVNKKYTVNKETLTDKRNFA